MTLKITNLRNNKTYELEIEKLRRPVALNTMSQLLDEHLYITKEFETYKKMMSIDDIVKFAVEEMSLEDLMIMYRIQIDEKFYDDELKEWSEHDKYSIKDSNDLIYELI